MAGLQFNPAIINQNWGTLLYNTAQCLADCNGINDFLFDEVRLPRENGASPASALVAAGIAQSDADLWVPAFGDMATVWRITRNQQNLPATNDFWFHARQCFGDRRMPG
jgi:hypothetical protein